MAKRTYGVERIALQKIIDANPVWFSRSNKRFFGDRKYLARYGGITGALYLCQETAMWNWSGGRRQYVWWIHLINDNYEVGQRLDIMLEGKVALNQWLRVN